MRVAIHQIVRYEYDAPVGLLRNSLYVLPPLVHGDQRRVCARVEVSGAPARWHRRVDTFGNEVVEVSAPAVQDAIQFDAWTVVERRGQAPPVRTRLDRRLLAATPLTRPDRALRAAASALGARDRGQALAERICGWVHDALTYEHGVTDVSTTAAEALARGRGVCQDQAHVMLALCRLLGLPARYVSGHLPGEGGTHAWVEVLVAEDATGLHRVAALDPSQGSAAGRGHVTVAVGRDYADVPPTSGCYEGSASGSLRMRKEAVPAAV